MFLDMTIHDFDMARFLAGSDIESLYVQAACLVDPAIGEAGDVDSAVITLKFKNGALGVIDNSRRAPTATTSASRYSAPRARRRRRTTRPPPLRSPRRMA